jgi:hypothetical protein
VIGVSNPVELMILQTTENLTLVSAHTKALNTLV